MTNVPDNIREIWTDLYKLFDRHYLMENNEADWKSFWDDAKDIYVKYNGNLRVLQGAGLISDVIGDRMKNDDV